MTLRIFFFPIYVKWQWFCLKGFLHRQEVSLWVLFKSFSRVSNCSHEAGFMAQIMHVLCGPGVVTFCLPKLLRWKTKRRHLPWQSRVLGDGVSLCISRLDKTPERWRLCLLTDGFLVWHLTGGRSGSISQSIVHLICCSVALMKMQGNILMGFF